MSEALPALRPLAAFRPLFAASLLAGLLTALAPVRAQSLDAVFTPACNAEVFGLSVQPDGKILVAGSFTQIGGVARNRLARLNLDGTVDAGFNPNAGSPVRIA